MYICDLHNDFFTSEKAFSQIEKDFDKNCRNVIFALYKGARNDSQIITAIRRIKRFNDPRFNLAFEDIGYFNDSNIDFYTAFKPLYVSLTWNYENPLGYGCYQNAPLKNEGFKIIKKLNQSNIAVDTAHICEKGFCNILDNADRVLNSHTCFSKINSNKRNIKEWQIKKLIEKKGIIGLSLVGQFLTSRKNATSEHFLRHLKYFLDKFGDDNICLGTDFFGTDNLPCDIQNYEMLMSVAEQLICAGYSYKTVEKIFYKNFEMYFRREIN